VNPRGWLARCFQPVRKCRSPFSQTPLLYSSPLWTRCTRQFFLPVCWPPQARFCAVDDRSPFSLISPIQIIRGTHLKKLQGFPRPVCSPSLVVSRFPPTMTLVFRFSFCFLCFGAVNISMSGLFLTQLDSLLLALDEAFLRAPNVAFLCFQLLPWNPSVSLWGRFNTNAPALPGPAPPSLFLQFFQKHAFFSVIFPFFPFLNRSAYSPPPFP